MIKESVLSKPQYETIHKKNQEVTMRDGTVLRANITRPNVEGKFPVLLERTPYNKEGGVREWGGIPPILRAERVCCHYPRCAWQIRFRWRILSVSGRWRGDKP